MKLLRSMGRLSAAVPAMASVAVYAACPDARSVADRLQTVVSAESTTRDALITVRRAAQDWKNLLLRGRDPDERTVMQDRLDAQARSYRDQLAKLRGQVTTPGRGLDRVRALDEEREKMFERYRSALALHGVESLDAAAAADREAQGADVPTLRALEQLILTMAEQSSIGFDDLRAAIDRCGVAHGEVAR